VVTEELGIAKGIRRVTALTGTKARDAQDLAKEAVEELEHIKTLQGKEKEKAAKGYLLVC
jgi:alanyl-tRNA synthetase